jgi:hypothetical protein
MNRVYLLLRDNIESGPYTFDELLQQQLQPSDLIWIEGTTLAWAYPNEVEELRKSLTGKTVESVSLGAIVPLSSKIAAPEVKNPAGLPPKKESNQLPVSSPKKPKGEIEKRAEELRKKALAFSSQHSFQQQPVLHPIHDFQPHLHDHDAVHLVHHKHNNGLPVGEILVAAMMIGLVIIGWYGGANKYFFNRKAPQVNTVATQLVASDTHAAASPVKSQAPVQTTNSTSQLDSTAIHSYSNNLQKAPVAHVKNPAEIRKDSQGMVQQTQLAALNNSGDTETKQPEKIIVTEKKQAENTEAKEPEKKQPAEVKSSETKSPEIKKEQAVKQQAAPEEDKKKTLGDVFKGIFKKKKKDN